MVDLFSKLRMEAGPLAKYSHLPDDYFFFPKLEGEIGPRMKFNGKEVLNWSLNNYLGLANHPKLEKPMPMLQLNLVLLLLWGLA
jgi:glycine C-acetyltransferase